MRNLGIATAIILATATGCVESEETRAHKLVGAVKSIAQKVSEGLDQVVLQDRVFDDRDLTISEPVAYNVEKTSSLVSPYTANVQYVLRQDFGKVNGEPFIVYFQDTCNLSYQGDRWVVKGVQRQVEGGKSFDLLATGAHTKSIARYKKLWQSALGGWL